MGLSFNDPRSTTGTLSRGTNIYNGGNNNATRSGSSSPWGRTINAPTPQPAVAPTGSSPAPGRYVRPSSPAPAPSSGGSIGSQFPGRPTSPAPSRPSTGGTLDRPGITTSPTPSPPSLGGSGGGASEGSTGSWIPVGMTEDQWDTLPEIAPIVIPETDPQLETDRANADMFSETLRNNQRGQEQRLEAQLNAIMERLGLQREDAMEGNEARMASQGIYRSGINTREQGRIGEQFNQAGSQAGASYSDAVGGLNEQVTTQLAQIAAQLNNAEAGFAQRAEQAVQAQAQAAAAAEVARRERIQELTGGTGTITSNPTGQMSWWQGDTPQVNQPASQPAGQPQTSFAAPSLPEFNLSAPQVPQAQQPINPAMGSAQYGGGPASLQDALRRRLYGG